MRNLAFVIWMIFFPVTMPLISYLEFLYGKTYTDDVHMVVALINLIIWIFIGKLLYEKRES